MTSIISILLLAAASTAREITFPPVAGYQSPLVYGNGAMQGDADITSARFAGLTTFANLPYTHCLAKDAAEAGIYDIAILGAPFDTVCTIAIDIRLMIRLMTTEY